MVEDQEVQPRENSNIPTQVNDNELNNKNDLITFDPYSTILLDKQKYPTLTPTYNDTETGSTTVEELIPIIYPTRTLPEELKYLEELNAIATTLPLYAGRYNNSSLKILIDCGASENYVSSHVYAIMPTSQKKI